MQNEDDLYYQQMLKFILQREGGYVNNPKDKGGETNKGITHGTYDVYRRSKGLKPQSVKNITDDEVRDIYYNNYYKASGADQLENPQLGLYVFDTAVNMGVGVAKDLLRQSGGNLETFEKLRQAKYKSYADSDVTQKGFLEGWNNQIKHAKNYAQESPPSKKAKPFRLGIEMDVDQNGNVMNYYNRDDLKNMSKQEIFDNLPTLTDQALYRLGHPTGNAANINNIKQEIIPTVHMGPQKASERLKVLRFEQLTPEEIDELLEELI